VLWTGREGNNRASFGAYLDFKTKEAADGHVFGCAAAPEVWLEAWFGHGHGSSV
jgi:hypothetical protein